MIAPYQRMLLVDANISGFPYSQRRDRLSPSKEPFGWMSCIIGFADRLYFSLTSGPSTRWRRGPVFCRGVWAAWVAVLDGFHHGGALMSFSLLLLPT
jgi:hypothetical protein